MPGNGVDIFISYRRSDAAGTRGRFTVTYASVSTSGASFSIGSRLRRARCSLIGFAKPSHRAECS